MTWTTDPEEITAVDAMRAAVRAMADLLAAVDATRWADPAGGVDLT